MKKVFVAAVIAAIVMKAYSLPSWYSEQVMDSEQIIYRETGGFIETTYTACASVKVDGEIRSLEKAKDFAIEEAYSKIQKKFNFLAAGEKKLLHCFYDDALESAAAYVQVSYTLSRPYVEEPAVPKTSMDLLRDYSGALDAPLKIDGAKLTITAMVKTNVPQKDGRFCIGLSEKTESILNTKVTATNKYPNGVPVKDDVATYSDSEFRFTFKNCIKRLRTFVIVRADMNSECDEVSLVYKDIEVKEKIQHTKDNRWRNLVFEFEKGLINEYTPEFVLKTDGKTVSLGSFFVYQEL
ncbi:hypothetical protein [Treponema sp.]|uniref:hypothetical protein n=1 Tax=Treponema sp. TaxID=166 RepID=UPI00298E2810|nr:hypothetical protein [Treponema sp.]MCQ2240000.1 hypothetical protein [Treponema sp.]